MNRTALEHILRAAAAIADERDFVVIGSQAILGQFPHAPDALLVSIEADIYPRQAPAKSDLIDGAIGELSMFHQTFGYYAHGVDETTATLPAGWGERLVPLANVNYRRRDGLVPRGARPGSLEARRRPGEGPGLRASARARANGGPDASRAARHDAVRPRRPTRPCPLAALASSEESLLDTTS